MAESGALFPGGFSGWIRWPRGRRACRRCGRAIPPGGFHRARTGRYCSEGCAVLARMEEASQAAWAWALLESRAEPRDLHFRAQLRLARLRRVLAQWRLERRLRTGRPAGRSACAWPLPVFIRSRRSWPRCAVVGLALILVAWGAASGRGLQTRGTAFSLAPVPPPALPASARLSPPTPPGQPQLPPPTSPASAEDFTQGNPSVPEIAFTFDGHDGATVAGEILDFLQARGARATLFLGGRFIRVFPDLVRRMVADGHEIGNHLDTHPYLTTYAQNRRHETLPGVTREVVLGELRRAEASFRALTGRSMAPYWRAPYGEHNGEIRAWAADGGYRHIGWTRRAGAAEDLDTRDWVADTSSRIYRSREEIVTRILEFGGGRPGALNGGVILMHLNTHRQADRPHEALPHLLKSLQDQGYRLVTVSELLAHATQRHAVVASSATPQSSAKVQALIR